MTREEEIRARVHDENDSWKPWAISGEDADHLIELLDESRTEHARAEKELDEALARVEVVAGERDEARKSIEAHAEYLARMTEERNQAVKDLEISQGLCADAIGGCDQQRERAELAEKALAEARRERDLWKAAVEADTELIRIAHDDADRAERERDEALRENKKLLIHVEDLKDAFKKDVDEARRERDEAEKLRDTYFKNGAAAMERIPRLEAALREAGTCLRRILNLNPGEGQSWGLVRRIDAALSGEQGRGEAK